MPMPPGAFWTNDDAHVASLRVVFGWVITALEAPLRLFG